MLRALFICVVLTTACASGAEPAPAPVATDPDSTAAQTEAIAWLALVDAGQWQASLDRAAPLLRQMTGTAQQWAEFVQGSRARYPVGERRLVRWEPDYDAPGAPPGDYARLAFASGAGTTETIVLVRTDAGWRVAMYGLGG